MQKINLKKQVAAILAEIKDSRRKQRAIKATSYWRRPVSMPIIRKQRKRYGLGPALRRDDTASDLGIQPYSRD